MSPVINVPTFGSLYCHMFAAGTLPKRLHNVPSCWKYEDRYFVIKGSVSGNYLVLVVGLLFVFLLCRLVPSTFD